MDMKVLFISGPRNYQCKNKYFLAKALRTTQTIVVYLSGSLYDTDKVNMYKTAAKEVSEILFNLSSINGFVANQE